MIQLITSFAYEESDEGCVKAREYIIATLFTIVRQSFGPLPISGRPISLHHVRASNGIPLYNTNGCSANCGCLIVRLYI